jgi:putative hydrolase of the HAD superfamily
MNPGAERDWVIVFDLDDTLYPEADYVRSGFQAVDDALRPRGIQGFEPLANGLFQEGLRGKIFDAALAKLGAAGSPELVAELVQIYRAHLPRLQLFPDARRALDLLRQSSKVALLTDGYAAVQRNKVRGLGLESAFAACIYTDDLGRECWKPSEVPFLEIATMLEMTDAMDRLVYVADNPMKDFIAPNRLGWSTVRIKRPGGEYAAMEPREASHAAGCEIQSLDELAALFGEANRKHCVTR